MIKEKRSRLVRGYGKGEKEIGQRLAGRRWIKAGDKTEVSW